MELRGKQKRYLRARAHSYRPVFSIGKNGLTEAWLNQLDGALDNHELLKINIQQSSDVTTSELKNFIESNTNIQVVQVIGRVLVLFKVSETKENREISNEVKKI
ncbi:ribosome assembly RNA-binding protein YhbY [Pediococcus stilesii]|uniref:Ribosome assembly RNA-binding protein YhbY n=1 Tax=Pediococcus stilesii TaxID=331679 RepID=A0A5R9BVU1_9LACO|nr:ribosome assembly RNA-binding protein YhbY [Pediococcus stilesii]TLQ04685.1 ribosome assembly RNA-binding protein YhbY [Pediococcus stilesii]